ncbi:hypothetical protein [Streptomyces sp. MMBL 11-1]|uniref:hypothetical protein n=1 Tax=Streptomyces sp. MMBL 11-1 TaxID=3026420 RepID=UPI00235F4A7B|nr:hypothetical protein [Streptomyces sp. MMBL 11-1]
MPRTLIRQKNGTWRARKHPKFVIFDEILGDYCALPGKDGKPETLQWDTREGAYEWLAVCADRWKEWEHSTLRGRVPTGWRGFKVPESSPWAGYTTPVTPHN